MLKTPHLEFVYGSYLYFIGGADRDTGALYRLNVTDGIVQQVTTASRGSTYWISPDGSTVYYANHGPAGGPGIYAVNSDGTNLRVLRPDGEQIGYAADNSLIIMLKVNSKFEIVKLGATIQQDFVLLADATPGASSAEMALAPYGHAVIVLGMYADGSQKIWSDDLTTDKQFVMVTPAKSSTQVQLPGWDRIAVA